MLGVSNSNATMYFLQLRYFYHKILEVQKIVRPPPKRYGDIYSPSP